MSSPFSNPAVIRLATMLAGIALVAIGACYCLHGELNADEGFYLFASRLVSEGFRPYADFGFTQTPLLAYANLPWLSLFGFSLTGIRLAGLAWTVLAVTMGCITLRRHFGWFPAFVFCVLLLASPGWLAFCVKGKTYAFTSLCVLAGTISLNSRGDARIRWTLFTLAAAAGVSARLPIVPFFVIGWLFLFFENRRWQERLIGTATTLILAAGCILFAVGGEWDSFRFWVLDFHLASETGRLFAMRLKSAFGLAPGVWLLLAIAAASLRVGRSHHEWVAPQIAVWVCLASSIVPNTGYGEYATPLLPAAALVASRQLADLIPPNRPGLLTCVFALVLGIGWMNPPPLDKDLLENAGEAENFLRTHVPDQYSVVASMPEIPAATGHSVPLSLAPGKFSVTEDFGSVQAAGFRMTTPETLGDIIHRPETGALVFSPAPRWNFGWSLPSYRPMSKQGTSKIFGRIAEDFVLAFENRDYVIFLRKELLTPDHDLE